MTGVQAEQLAPARGHSRNKTRGSRRRSSRSRVRTACPRRRRDGSRGSIGSAKIVSRASARRSRGPARSIGVSLEPSGIQTFVTHGVPSALPKAAPMRRQAMPWSIQNRRIDGVCVCQRVTARCQRMGEIGGIEVHAHVTRSGPIDPVDESVQAASASRSTFCPCVSA